MGFPTMHVSFCRATVVAAATLIVLAGCDQRARTTQPPPSTNYAKKSTTAVPARGPCLTEDEMQAVRNEITWTQFYNAAIQCRAGTPAFASDYGAFRNKFRADNELNSAPLQRAAAKRRANIHNFKTEIANRDGAAAGTNPQYCANAYQGFRWALSQQVNNLSQVPPLMDFLSEFGVSVCTASPAPGRKN